MSKCPVTCKQLFSKRTRIFSKMHITNKWFESNTILFLAYRITSVILVQTSYVPDEYWQSLEVAHKMVFGYGYMTWEWKNALRSSMYPSVFVYIYKVLKFLKIDSPATVTVIPRLVQAVLTAIADNYFFHLCKNLGCKSFWTKVFIFTNWFWYFCGSRTILNMFETSLTIIALYYYPWNIIKHKVWKNDKKSFVQWIYIRNQSVKYLILIGLNCIVRPTALIIWTPLVLYQLLKLYPTKILNFVFAIALPISAFIICISLCIDYLFYERWIFPPYNFFIFNINSGIASFYGEHPIHWYITQGIPAVLGLHVLPFMAGSFLITRSCKKSHKDKFEKINIIIITVVIINIAIFSLIPHKEFRFILPLVPMMEIVAIKFISDSSLFNSRKKCSSLLTTVLIIGFVVPAALFGIFHQKGTLVAMKYLSGVAHKQPDNTSILFLTPCHSAPLYSHLHINISARFLTCDPPITSEDIDESEDFFRNPISWMESNWNKLNNPSHVVLFDSTEKKISHFLNKKGLSLKKTFSHTIFKGSSAGDNVLVYER